VVLVINMPEKKFNWGTLILGIIIGAVVVGIIVAASKPAVTGGQNYGLRGIVSTDFVNGQCEIVHSGSKQSSNLVVRITPATCQGSLSEPLEGFDCTRTGIMDSKQCAFLGETKANIEI